MATAPAPTRRTQRRAGEAHTHPIQEYLERRQVYALLKAVIAPAVAAGRIASNLCQIKGAGIANSEERPYMPPEVLDSIVARARHRTARAGLIYQHAAEERSRLVAERMDALASGASAVARLEAVVQLGIPALTSTGR